MIIAMLENMAYFIVITKYIIYSMQYWSNGLNMIRFARRKHLLIEAKDICVDN